MNPDNAPSQPDHAASLRALPSLPPKRRCKAPNFRPENDSTESVIIPFYNPAHKPMRFHRSGQPFQVWKEAEPHRHEPSNRKSGAHASLSESLQAFARTVTGPWHVNPSP